LQKAQYGAAYATWDEVVVDYVGWARAMQAVVAFDGGRSTGALRSPLDQAYAHDGLSLIYVPAARIRSVDSARAVAGTSAVGLKPRKRCDMRSGCKERDWGWVDDREL
jgi:hypothetical protein